ncbi:MAG: hypothetical protein N2Z58_04055 [Fervidobacterium sp.]|nr:hypothetical protein [Fervidobacterium sp.]
MALNTDYTAIGGSFSPDFIGAPWSMDRFIDLLKHIWIPLIVIGLSGVGELLRVMRANLLDVRGLLL